MREFDPCQMLVCKQEKVHKRSLIYVYESRSVEHTNARGTRG